MISVIIPTYKPKDYLFKCLQSLEGQTLDREQFEIIIVLNGCGEPYASKIKEYIDQFLPNAYLFIESLGSVSNARNVGIDNSRGEYITFVDDDDYVSSQFLEKLLQKANEKTVSLSMSYSFNDGEQNYYENELSEEYKRRSPNGIQPLIKIRKYFSGPWMKLIHKDIIGDRRFNTNFSNGEDGLFNYLISDRIHFVAFSDQDAVYYRRVRYDSMMGKNYHFFSRLLNVLRLYKEFIKIFISSPSNYSFAFLCKKIMGGAHSIIDYKPR